MFSFSSEQTKKIAEILAQEVLKKPPQIKNALVFGLVGDLGAGKTAFVQAFIKAAGIKKRITSPTFILIRNYKLLARHTSVKQRRARLTSNFKLIYHIDCYRVKKPAEFLKLGLKEILTNPQNIVLIEWAEKIKNFLPKNAVWIKFEYGKKENERIIKINA